MIFIHKLIPLPLDDDTLYIHGLELSTPLLNIEGRHYSAQPLKVHQPPDDEFDVPGTRIWFLTGEDMYFTTADQAERVFVLLYGRMPDPGTEIHSVELTRVKDLYSDPEPNYDGDQTDRDAVQADYQAEQRETDRYYGCDEHAMFGDRWYYNDCPGAW